MRAQNDVNTRIGVTDNTQQGLNQASSRFSKFTQGIEGMTGRLSGILSGVGFGLASALTLGMDSSFNKLKIQTGIIGEEFQGLKAISLDVFRSGFGNNIDEVNQSISGLRREFKDLNEEELKETSKGVLLIANNFDKDVNETLRATTSLMKNYGLTGQQSNDLLLKGLQLTGDSYNDMLDTVNEYSLQLSQNGIGYKQFMNILISGTKNGLRNTDEMADMLREFGIRILDNSDKTKKAFSDMGMDYDKFKTDLASGNTTIGESLTDISKKISGIKDPIKQAEIGTAIFGTKFEDNGVKIVKSISEMKDELGEFNGTVAETSKVLEQDLGKSFNSFKVAMYETLQPLSLLFSGLAKFITNNQKLVSVISVAVTIFGTLFTIIKFIVGIMALFGATVSAPVWGTILAVISGIAVASGLVLTYWEEIVGLFNKVKGFLGFDTTLNSENVSKVVGPDTGNIVNPGNIVNNNQNNPNTNINNKIDIKIEGGDKSKEEIADELIDKFNRQQQVGVRMGFGV